MASFDLPRPLSDYFAFAETTPTREGRRFSITLPYLRADGRIDRLQWWYHVAEGKQKILGEEAVRAVRAKAIERFSRHIERWLCNTAQTLRAEGPIPQLLHSGANNIDLACTPAESGSEPVSHESVATVAENPIARERIAVAKTSTPAERSAVADTEVVVETAAVVETAPLAESAAPVPSGKTAFG